MPSVDVTADDLADLINQSLQNFDRLKFGQIAQNLQEYEILPRWLRKDRVIIDHGWGIKRSLMTALPTAGRHVGLFAEDNIVVEDLMNNINIGWAHYTTNYAWEVRELLMNRGAARIVDHVKVRRTGAMIALAEDMEEAAWTLRDASDELSPNGIPYYVVKNATEGFNGGAPTGFTDVAGLNPTNFPKWKNWTAQYANVTKADLITKMRKAHQKINFKSPVNIPDFRKGKGDTYRIYVNHATELDFAEVGESQNENLGRDLAPMDGKMTFKSNPIIGLPQLNDDTTNPIYMLNMGKWYTFVLKGDFLRESKAKPVANRHNTIAVYLDHSYNYLCWDRRAQAVLSMAA